MPPAPTIAATFSGFVVGIVFALIAMGAVGRGAQSTQATPTVSPPANVADTTMQRAVTRIVARVLGPGYPDSKQPRLVHISLVGRTPGFDFPEEPERGSIYRSVYIDFRLNDHPLGRAWRMRAARADVFGVMRALYTSSLPVYDVGMTGLFPMDPAHRSREARVLVVFMDHSTAQRIPWKHWGRDKEARLWQQLPYKSINRRFG